MNDISNEKKDRIIKKFDSNTFTKDNNKLYHIEFSHTARRNPEKNARVTRF